MRRGSVFVLVLAPQALFAQLNVMTSGGFGAAYRELVPVFEKNSGVTVKTAVGPSQGSGPSTIPAQLRAGAAVDVVVMSRDGLAELIAEGRILPGSAVDLARVPMGAAVRAGAAKPDISTVEAFKQMVLRAKSINLVSSPAIYMAKETFPKLGIAAEAAAKIKDGTVATVVNGETEIALRPVSELLNVPGLDFVGLLPREIQLVSVFSAAIVSGSKQTEPARRLIAWLKSQDARPAIRKSGMEPIPD